MEFTSKEYKTFKIKNYLKNDKNFFFFNGINQNYSNWVKTEQSLKNINLSYYKILNKTSNKTFQNSIYKNMRFSINSVTFFIKPIILNPLLSKKILFNLDIFVFLAFKLNNKIYSSTQVKYTNSFNYCENKLLLFQFNLINIKSGFLIK